MKLRAGFSALLAAGLMSVTSACQRDALARDQLPVIAPSSVATTTEAVATSIAATAPEAMPSTAPTTMPSTGPAPTTAPAPLDALASDDVTVIAPDDPALPVEMHLPLTNSAEFNDVLSAWAGYHRSEFYGAARAELAARQKAAAAAAAERAAADAAYAQQVADAAAASVPPPTTPAPQPAPELPPPSMQVTGEVFGAGAADTGVRLRSVRVLKGAPIEWTLALHRLPTGAVIESPAMFTPDGRTAVTQAVRDLLGDRAGDWTDAAPAAVLADVQILADGSLAVNVTPYLLAPGATAPVEVTVSPEVTAGALSPYAQRILAGATDRDPAPNCATESCVALTFDDGPSDFTPRLLDVLANAHTSATFFMVGKSVARYPEIAKAVADGGHEIGNHTWSHPRLGKLPTATQQSEIDATQAALEQATGRTPDMLRPPYGVYNDSTRRFGLALALWNVDTRDWQYDDIYQTVTTAMQQVKPGSIILMHDIKQSSVDGVAWLMVRLRSAGYRFVTMHQLFGPTDPGAMYYSTDHVEPPLPPTTAPPPTPAPAAPTPAADATAPPAAAPTEPPATPPPATTPPPPPTTPPEIGSGTMAPGS